MELAVIITINHSDKHKDIETPIDGPFKFAGFSLVTSAPLAKRSDIYIQWEKDFWAPSKAAPYLWISYHSVDVCNSSTPLEMYREHDFKGKAIWTFYISSSKLTIRLNGKLAFVSTKRGEIKDCNLWTSDLDSIATLTGPIEAMRTYDKDSDLHDGEWQIIFKFI